MSKLLKNVIAEARRSTVSDSLERLNAAQIEPHVAASILGTLPSCRASRNQVRLLEIGVATYLIERPEDYGSKDVMKCQQEIFRLSVHPLDYAIAQATILPARYCGEIEIAWFFPASGGAVAGLFANWALMLLAGARTATAALLPFVISGAIVSVLLTLWYNRRIYG